MKREIALKYVAVITVLLLAGCNFNLLEKSDNILASYKVGGGRIIEVHSIAFGATGNDLTIIGIKEAAGGKLDTLKRIEDNFESYKTDIVRVNDTIFQLKFTDTAYQTGKAKSISFNIRNKSK